MEFLFENPFLLIILIGLISSFFKKGKEEQEQPRKRSVRPESPKPRQMSRPEEPRQPDDPRNHRPAPLNEREPDKPIPTVTETALTDIQKKYEERRQQKANKDVGSDAPPSFKPSPKPAHEEIGQPNEGDFQLRPEADRLIEGIAWAQVLGPPRSKKPHRTMRR